MLILQSLSLLLLSLRKTSLEKSNPFLSKEHQTFWETSLSFLDLNIILAYSFVPSSWKIPYKYIHFIFWCSNVYLPWYCICTKYSWHILLLENISEQYSSQLFLGYNFLGLSLISTSFEPLKTHFISNIKVKKLIMNKIQYKIIWCSNNIVRPNFVSTFFCWD